MTMDIDNPITMSPLCQKIERGGRTVEVLIYENDDSTWILEVVDEANTSLVWDDTFKTDQAALDEILSAIEEEGIATLFQNDSSSESSSDDNFPEPLELIATLTKIKNTDALSYYQIYGFLFAVSCCPELIQPSEWMTVLLGDDLDIDGDDNAKAVFGGIISLYNYINESISEHRCRLPQSISILPTICDNFGDDAPLGQWSQGFMKGHTWLKDIWDEYIPDRLKQEYCSVLLILNTFSSYELMQEIHEQNRKNDTISVEDFVKNKLIEQGLFQEAMTSYAHMGRSISEALASISEQRSTSVVNEPKIGRNDQCPCGSGKKYKKCCLSQH